MRRFFTLFILIICQLGLFHSYGQTADLGGSVLDNNNESAIRAGGDSLLIVLTGDTWADTLGQDNTTTTELINSITGNSNWSTVTSALDYTNVFRRSDDTISVVLPAVSGYDIYSDETITVLINVNCVNTSATPVAGGMFTIEHDSVKAFLTGTVTGSPTETEIRSGGEDIILTIRNDILVSGASFDAIRTDIISGMSGDQNWADLLAVMDPSDVVRTNDTVVTITIPSNQDYFITGNETVSTTIPASALENHTYAVSADLDFTVTNVATTAVLSGSVTSAPSESDIRAGTEDIILTIRDDKWFDGAIFDGIRSDILSGMSGDQNWADLVLVMSETDVVRTNDTVVTISIPTNTSYYIGSDETVTVTIPGSALQYYSTGVVASPTFTIINEGVTLTVSGTVTTAPQKTENDIRTNQETIILTLDGDTWVPQLDNNNGVAADLLTNITGSTSWNTEVMGGLNSANITLTDNYTCVITLDAAPGYEISSEDDIRIEVPNSVLFSTGAGSLISDPAFSILPENPSVSVSGNIMTGIYDFEDSIRSGQGTIVLELSEDSWVVTLGNNNSITGDLVNGLSGSTAWNTLVVPEILGADNGAANVDVSGSTVTITLPAAITYEILENDTIRITVPVEAFETYTYGDTLLNDYLVIYPAPEEAIIPDPGLLEYQVEGASVTINLKELTFFDSNLSLSNFISSTPSNIDIQSVTWISPTQATAVLERTGDFDTDITDFNITIDASELSSTSNLTSNDITITADLEPQITNVNIIENTFKIGDIVRVDITTINDGGDTYVYAGGNVAGNTLDSVKRVSSTLYYGYFTVEENDQDFLASDLIPVVSLQLDNLPVIGEVYDGNIDNQTIIDAHYPVINYMTVSGNVKKIGDQIDIIVSADGNDYEAVLPSAINNVFITDGDVTFSSLGNGVYLFSYVIDEGDDDVPASNLQASLIVEDIAGNSSTLFSTLNSNNISIDANSPQISQISVPDEIYSIGDIVEITVLADDNDYSFNSETTINGIPFSSSYITGSYISGSEYRLYYTVRSSDPEVEAGNLEVSVSMNDAAGNQGAVYDVVESNSLAIYTVLPTATILGGQEICEDDSATLIVNLNGRFPLEIYIWDGSTTTHYNGLLSSSFDIKVSPSATSSYRIDSVLDYNGIKNTGTGLVTITVNDKTDVNIINLNQNYSRDDDPFVLEADITGGTFYGPGVVSATSVFDPSVADTTNSPHTLYYTYENAKGCVSMDSAIVFVLGAEGDILIPKEVFCDYENDFVVLGSNTAGSIGVFTLLNSNKEVVPGLADQGNNSAIVSPDQLSEDIYTVEYKYDDGGASLILRENFTIESVQVPRILAPDQTAFCQNDELVSLVGDIELAVFSGPGVSYQVDQYVFDPSAASVGDNTIEYTNTTVNGCYSTVLTNLEVYYVPDVEFIEDDVCIIGDNKDTTSFQNLTPDKHVFSTWTWNFDDIYSLDNISNAVEGSHSYKDPGNRTITLTGNTINGCAKTFSRTIQFGNKPDGGFNWNNECYVEGDSIMFINAAIAEDPINYYSWKFFNSPDDSIVYSGSDLDQVYYTFPGIETYNVELQVQTTIGCTNYFKDSIQLKNTFRLGTEGEYFNDFESGDGRWSIEQKSESEYNSWKFGMTGYSRFEPDKNSNAWYLEPPDISNVVEQSYILSPCFDLRGMEKPMISVDIFRDMLANEGVTLQYTVDNGMSWENLGFIGEGINWFNSFSIAGAPDGQEIGWSGEQTGNEWESAKRYASDEIEDIPNVQFRFIYGVEHSKGLDREGFAFDNFKICSRTRMVLMEQFTNGSESDVSQSDSHINILYNENFEDVVKLEYHTNLGGDDIFNSHNPYVPSTRVLYYGVGNVPYTTIDGGNDGLLKFDTPSTILQIENSDVILQSLYEPSFDIDLDIDYNASDINIGVEITALDTLEADERLVHIVVFEKKVTDVTMNNGQHVFLNVVKDMVPNAAGTAFFNAWSKGQSEVINYTWSHLNVYDNSMLRIAVFVQNDNTREVYQAATDDTTNLTTSIERRKAAIIDLSVYPNPANDYLIMTQGSWQKEDLIIELYDQLGRLVLTDEWYKTETRKRLDLSECGRGLYILKVNNLKGSSMAVQKISIAR